jgi:hypothetical protein
LSSSGPLLPAPRGSLSEFLLARLAGPAATLGSAPAPDDDPLRGEDFHLALYVCYELHYRSFAGVDERWEWEPSLLDVRRRLEDDFEAALNADVGPVPEFAPRELDDRLREAVSAAPGPSLARFVAREATLEQFRELAVHRSAFQLKEADPQSWAIPRLAAGPKAALVEIQVDEYGSGHPERMHSTLYADAMRALDLDDAYGAYLDLIPGVSLATVNVMSLFGLHRRRRGALVGHLALYEMTSPEANRRYANALRRLGFGPPATAFYDEHVEADALHEAIAVHDMAAGLASDEPETASDVLAGALSLLSVERRLTEDILAAWGAGRSSLVAPLPALLRAG